MANNSFTAWTLISEDDGKSLSLGRLSFWIILSFCSYFWFFVAPVLFPETLFYVLCFLMLYNFSKKTIKSMDIFLEAWAQKKLGGLTSGTALKDIVKEVSKAMSEDDKN